MTITTTAPAPAFLLVLDSMDRAHLTPADGGPTLCGWGKGPLTAHAAVGEQGTATTCGTCRATAVGQRLRLSPAHVTAPARAWLDSNGIGGAYSGSIGQVVAAVEREYVGGFAAYVHDTFDQPQPAAPVPAPSITVSADTGMDGYLHLLRRLSPNVFRFAAGDGTVVGMGELLEVDDDGTLTFRPWDDNAGDCIGPEQHLNVNRVPGFTATYL